MVETVGFLCRLRRDVRGNVLALMAALLVPLAILSGSAVDLARVYSVKTRLQQACDAGALAGRKMMNDSGATLSADATATAQSFFQSNFQSGWFKTNTVSFNPIKTTEGQVSATATATVPMTIMAMVGMPARTITVTCEARYDVADADIVFVLDTTGSMACLTSDAVGPCGTYASTPANVVPNGDGSYSVKEKAGSRISSLRAAVVKFYNTLTTGADPTTHFRFGFVPYSSTVNVGHLLPNNYLATSWNYQTRWRLATATDTNISTFVGTATTMTQAACDAQASPGSYDANDQIVVKTVSYSGGKCTLTTKTNRAMYHYAQTTTPIDVSAYTQFQAVTNPAKLDGSKSTWLGCIEERDPGATPSANPSASSPPLDLDVDTIPTSDPKTRWGPMWMDIEYWRNASGAEDSSTQRSPLTRTTAANDDSAMRYNLVSCPKQALRLQTLSASDITDYLSAANGFRPYGHTFHDVGMTWGTRLLAPNGIFASDTAAWPGHNPPNRYIIFLTDGAMDPDEYAYASHGMEHFDKRVTGSAGTADPNYTNLHNKRFTTACQIAKNRNITIFVIAYAQTKTPELIACASPGQDYYASDSTALDDAFSKIAKQVAMLRISK